jgi:hypothetical protein
VVPVLAPRLDLYVSVLLVIMEHAVKMVHVYL